jgi:hypothetical protein
MVIWYKFRRFGILCQEKSGNSAFHLRHVLQLHTKAIVLLENDQNRKT